jgi:hypothetical protein
MRIEVATHPTAAAKTKGDLLETLSAQILTRQQYAVRNQVRRTASELDLDCAHKVSHRTLYVECKAQREPLSANVLTNLLGNLHFHGFDETWLISTGPLGKDAKGFQRDWQQKPEVENKRLSIYTPDRIIDLLSDSGFIGTAPVQTATQAVGGADQLGEWTLLLTEYGLFWAVVVLESRVPASALVFDAKGGNRVTDPALLRQIASLDSTIGELNLDQDSVLAKEAGGKPREARKLRVVQVQAGVDWADYRPARPEHFVGRKEAQDRVLSLLKAIREVTTKTRVFAITGDSGMGKSSLIAKLRDRCSNVRHRSKLFMFAVDVRAATEPGYVKVALLAALSEAARSGFGASCEAPLRITDHADPLASPSVAAYLASLEERGEVVCLVFEARVQHRTSCMT